MLNQNFQVSWFFVFVCVGSWEPPEGPGSTGRLAVEGLRSSEARVKELKNPPKEVSVGMNTATRTQTLK